jgi:dipeptidyl-peptidase-4
VSAAGGKTRWFQVPSDPSENYIPQMDWAGNSNEILFQHLNRPQNRNEVMVGDSRTGRVHMIMTDTDETWVHVIQNIHWLNNAQNFLWMSERDGWRHVYLVSRSGQNMTLLTPGDYDVESIEGVDEKQGWLYFIASPENPTQRYLYRVALDGSGTSERITPHGQDGTHSYQISPDSQWAFHTYLKFETPPVTSLIRLPSHKNIRTLVRNSRLRANVESQERSPVEFFRVDIGNGVMLDAWSMKPPDFDPQKKYPVLFYVYGEPWGSTVRDSWGGNRYLWHLMLNQQGYIVMSVDNRGTRVPRGREWRKIIYRQVGILASSDQAAAVRAIIASRDYVDPDRIGIWGRSGGGAMTLNAMFRYPDLYKTGMSVAPVTNQRLYNSIYQERYMGLPQDNADGYVKGSPVTFAFQLKGNLLLVHGTGDDNVHYQNTEMLIDELIKHNKSFTMMSYPNRSHGIREGKNTSLHLYNLLTQFLKKNLSPDPLPY